MKRISLITLLLMFAHTSYSQSWLWGKAGYGSLKANDFGSSVATDKHGNAFITGQYENSILFNPFTLNDLVDEPYLVKYDANGNVLWTVQGTGSLNDCFGVSVTTDTNSNVYITGSFTGTITFGSYTLSEPHMGGYDVYTVKYDASGNVLWAQQSVASSGSVFSQGYSVSTDKTGNVFVAGSFTDSISFGGILLKGILSYSAQSTNAFLVKYDASGNVLWAQQSVVPSSASIGVGYGVATDKMGNAFITGVFADTISFGGILLKGPQIIGAEYCAFLVKYDATGNALWAKQSISSSGYPASTYSYGVTTDKADNVYITGYYSGGTDFGPYTLTSNSYDEYFLVKYSATGKELWADQTNTANDGASNSISSDAKGHLYLTFQGAGSTIQFGGHTYNSISVNTTTTYISELDTNGKVSCGSALNGPYYSSYGNGVASDSTGKYIYAAGVMYGDTLQCGPDIVLPDGGTDPYVARWQSCCKASPLKVNGDTIVLSGTTTTLTASGATSYVWLPSSGVSCSTCPNTTITPTVNSTYTVIGTDSNGCETSHIISVD